MDSEETAAERNSKGGDALHSLESQLRDMKRAIKALQAHKDKPWYRREITGVISAVVALLALIFTGFTTYISYHRADVEAIQLDRSRLSDLDGDLGALQREYLDFSQKYPKNTDAINSFEAEVTAEQIAIVRQAADIIRRIPGYVSAAECTVVADYLERFDDNDLSTSTVKICIDRARDGYSLNQALNQYAADLFATGNIADGRKEYREALRAYERFPSLDKSYSASVLGYTELQWAGNELRSENCKEAKDQIEAAVEYSNNVVRYPEIKDSLSNSINAQKKEIDKCAAG